VKTVTPDAALVVFIRQAVELGDRFLRPVEGGIEAGHLRQIRLRLLHGPDRRQVVRLMQRRQRHEGFQPGHRRRRDQQRRRVIGSAMHHTVTDPGQNMVLETCAQQSGDPLQGLRMAGHFAVVPGLVDHPLAGAVLDLEAWCRPQALDLADRDGPHGRGRRQGKERELETRRAGVEYQDTLFHFRLPFSSAIDRCAGHQTDRRARGEPHRSRFESRVPS
jgi:hypothetical protein